MEQLPSGRWRETANHPTRRDANGRRLRERRVFDTLAEAEAWKTAMERDWDAAFAAYGIGVQRQRSGPKHSVQQVLEEYTTRRKLKKSSVVAYRRAARYIAEVLGPDRAIHTITREDCERFLRLMAVAGIGGSEQERRWAVLKGALRHAIKVGYATVDPTMVIDPPSAPPNRKHRILSDDEFWAIHEQLPADLKAPALLSVETGMRRGEVTGLLATNLDLKTGFVRVATQLVDGVIEQGTKGGPDATRLLGIEPYVREAIAAHVEQFGPGPQGLVFFDHVARRPWGHRTFDDHWRKACNRAKLADPQPVFHDLRHTKMTRAVRADWDVIEVQQMAGHKYITTTMIYAEAHKAERRAEWMASGGSPSSTPSPGGRQAPSRRSGRNR